MSDDCHCEHPKDAKQSQSCEETEIASSQETLLAMTAMKKEVEDDDPLQMVGIELTGQSEAELRDMALCFAEEFIREGWDELELFYMFRSPFYAGPYLAWKQKGDEFVRSVIQEAVAMWRPTKAVTPAFAGMTTNPRSAD